MIEFDTPTVARPPLRLLPPLPAPSHPLPVPLALSPSLAERLAQLAERYMLPALDLNSTTPARREIDALTQAGLDEAAYLLCLVVCVTRCSMGGTPLAFDAWARSALLTWCGATIFLDDPVQEDAGTGGVHQEFLEALARGDAGPLRLLVPAPLSAATLAALRAVLPEATLACDDLPDGSQRLSFTHGAVAAHEGASAPSACIIDVIASRLSRAVLLAQVWTERLDDIWIDLHILPTEEVDTGAGSGVQQHAPTASAYAPMVSAWLTLLPEVPPWVRVSSAPCAGMTDLYRRWLLAAPQPLSLAGAGAARCRAALTWSFASIAARCPAAGWLALLSTCVPAELPAAVAAARAAGYTLLPPSVLRSGVEWEPDATAGDTAFRAGLAAIAGAAAAAPAIVAERARGGPFQSIFDLALRVPSLGARQNAPTIARINEPAGAPPLLQRLVLAGALDELHERGTLLANWPAIAAWCEADLSGDDRRSPENWPALDGASAPSPEQVDVWSRALVPLAQALAEGPASTTTIGDALLPSALLSDPPAGAPVRVAGAVAALRHIEQDEQVVALLQLGDAAASVLVLAPADEAPVPGSWATFTVVRAGTAQGHAAWDALFATTALATPRTRRTVAVLVPRLGDRAADLERLLQIQALLQQHRGANQVQLYLLQEGRRRRLDTDDALAVAWSPALRAQLEAILGPGAVELLPAGE